MRNLFLSALLLASSSASAASISSHWAGSSVTMNMNPWMAILAQSAATAMQDVASDVYANPSNFYWTMQFDDDVNYISDNGESETTLTNSTSLLCGTGSDGCCYTWLDSSATYIDEADVYMNSMTAWTYSDARADSWAYGGGYRPFKSTFLHEIGHAAGLGHVNSTYNIMGIDFTHVYVDSTNAYEYLGEDATYGLRSAYGTYGGEDVGITHWKFSYAGAEYSAHARTGITSSTGAALSTTTSGTETVYKVSKGQQVRFEVTLENNGSSTKTYAYKTFVSTDSNITTADTQLSSSSLGLTPNTVSTTYFTVTIPSTLTSGQTYYLGAVMDPSNSVAEINESNNAAWTMIRVN